MKKVEIEYMGRKIRVSPETAQKLRDMRRRWNTRDMECPIAPTPRMTPEQQVQQEIADGIDADRASGIIVWDD